MPRHVQDTWSSYLGPGALASFGIAAGTAVLGLGLPVLYRLGQVIGAARRDGRRNVDCILVLGRALRGINRPRSSGRASSAPPGCIAKGWRRASCSPAV
jgi:hypothetical protein